MREKLGRNYKKFLLLQIKYFYIRNLHYFTLQKQNQFTKPRNQLKVLAETNTPFLMSYSTN